MTAEERKMLLEMPAVQELLREEREKCLSELPPHLVTHPLEHCGVGDNGETICKLWEKFKAEHPEGAVEIEQHGWPRNV